MRGETSRSVSKSSPGEPHRVLVYNRRAAHRSSPRCTKKCEPEGMFMRPRRRRPRGTRPNDPQQPGAAPEGSSYDPMQSAPPAAYDGGSPADDSAPPSPRGPPMSPGSPMGPTSSGGPGPNGVPR